MCLNYSFKVSNYRSVRTCHFYIFIQLIRDAMCGTVYLIVPFLLVRGATMQIWNNIRGDPRVLSSLFADKRYPKKPSRVRRIRRLVAPANSGNRHSVRLAAYYRVSNFYLDNLIHISAVAKYNHTNIVVSQFICVSTQYKQSYDGMYHPRGSDCCSHFLQISIAAVRRSVVFAAVSFRMKFKPLRPLPYPLCY